MYHQYRPCGSQKLRSLGKLFRFRGIFFPKRLPDGEIPCGFDFPLQLRETALIAKTKAKPMHQQTVGMSHEDVRWQIKRIGNFNGEFEHVGNLGCGGI